MNQVEKLIRKYGYNLDDSEIFSGTQLVKMVGGLKKEYFTIVKTLGEHAKIVEGNDKILIVWDCGSDYYQIIMEW